MGWFKRRVPWWLAAALLSVVSLSLSLSSFLHYGKHLSRFPPLVHFVSPKLRRRLAHSSISSRAKVLLSALDNPSLSRRSRSKPKRNLDQIRPRSYELRNDEGVLLTDVLGAVRRGLPPRRGSRPLSRQLSDGRTAEASRNW